MLTVPVFLLKGNKDAAYPLCTGCVEHYTMNQLSETPHIDTLSCCCEVPAYTQFTKFSSVAEVCDRCI